MIIHTALRRDLARFEQAKLNGILGEHLAHEERDLEPFAASHASAPQMKDAQTAARKAHKGNTGTFSLGWPTAPTATPPARCAG